MKLREGQKEPLIEVLLDEFAYTLAETAERLAVTGGDGSSIGAKHDGVLLLIDEADNASPQMQLGAFLKLLAERLQRRGGSRVIFGLAGLPDLRDKLAKSHPSAPRVLQEVLLDRLSPTEVNQVIDIGLKRARKDHGVEVSITDEARALLFVLSEGYPHFIQQFAHSAYAADTDNVIDTEDVSRSAFGANGALRIIGDNYYRDDFYGMELTRFRGHLTFGVGGCHDAEEARTTCTVPA